ncbi:hypothetical protein PAXRUDRAFT_645738 [Paxillus rubicundulus Ve08.2h10]|uniref:Uncharacterized protein n=1 Tax=Paxillus rubicundulus Ve08.2h10 TaxID=930991 RepID=A0A0D0ED94_9AGAM|nr:hypothetical protein PAXRUDRAFT_645738 [Paxillus rubicundulus Ve08.2h10]
MTSAPWVSHPSPANGNKMHSWPSLFLYSPSWGQRIENKGGWRCWSSRQNPNNQPTFILTIVELLYLTVVHGRLHRVG